MLITKEEFVEATSARAEERARGCVHVGNWKRQWKDTTIEE
jgi:hypothetical protein